MIEFIKDNVALALDPKTKIRLEFNSPLFAEDVIEATKVFWFDLPLNATNIKALGHSNQPGASGKMQVYSNYYLRIMGFIELKGSLVVRTISDKFRVAFTTNDLAQYKKTLLTDFGWGDDITLGVTTEDVFDFAEAQILEEFPDVDFNFPRIYNPSFYGDINPAFDGFLNNYTYKGNLGLTDGFLRNGINEDPGEEDLPTGVVNQNALVPMFYLQHILTELADILGFVFTGEFFTDTDLQQIMLYNDFDLAWNEKEYWIECSGGSYVLGAHPITFSTYTMGDNATFNGSYFTVEHVGLHEFYLRVVLSRPLSYTDAPVISVWNNTTNEILGTATCDDGLTEVTLILYCSAFMETANIGDHVYFYCTLAHVFTEWTMVEAEGSVVNSSQTDLNRLAKSANLKNHVPKMMLNDFLKDLKMFWGLSLFFDNQMQSAQFSFNKDILDAAILDITDIVAVGEQIEIAEKKNMSIDFEWDGEDAATEDNFLSISDFEQLDDVLILTDAPRAKSTGEIVKVAVTNTYFKSGDADNNERRWLFYSDIPQKCFINNSADETTEIKLNANPLLMKNIAHVTVVNNIIDIEQSLVVPQILKKGKSILGVSEEEGSEEVLRFMNWVGMSTYHVIVGIDSDYPFATTSNYELDKTKCKNITLFLEGTDGIYNNYLKTWYEFISATEEVTFNMGVNFGAKHLLQLMQIICQPQSGDTTSNIRWLMIESIKYLPKKLTVEISMNNIESAELIAVKQSIQATETGGESGS
ncbi:MAG: hypothetical protein A2X13_14780 [Bacteroidetes bacterium GWC2_33_15]|nr:MAG: hypothetical protein A2X10_06845 [Bacteroidetes bacterium GWA2_33_15]OFX50138.1 MAG: hypothetical protein A2X13_14780 [Bacteroidetes bacterium GWC2_33_15]OFX65291.1 MAG: hypothetical protein A2X15_04355 [Bacteroidetes bacterium GWB2_32_14]OFX70517.1 MAG: hypothetical protein A2X14_04410 [Bacteroidetes bacterium GWD2_33_33]HAN19610.1 hypothetical protein [Bacteroidales bacterium]